MNDRIIAKDRYKKVTRKSIDKKKKMLNDKYGINGKLKQKKIKRESIFSLTIVKIFFILLAIFLLAILSRVIIKMENVPLISAFFDETNKLEENYNLSVGITNNYEKNIFKSNNLIINDAYFLATKSLVEIESDYSIKYELASYISKVNSKEYYVKLDNSYKLTSDNVKSTIYKILSNKENIYYDRMQVLSDIKIVSDYEFNMVLKEEAPYFIYYLDFPIYIDDDILLTAKNLNFKCAVENEKVRFNRMDNVKEKNLESVEISNFSNSQDMVEAFKRNELDTIFISSDSVLKLIGKYDYSMKKYRDGEALFLFGNKDSNIFKIKEIRQALLYSIDRESIIKSLNNSFIELIDLPYMYSGIMYKYDITAANNILLSNGWTKKGGIYNKEGNEAILKLLVNSDDKVKCNVAESIKNMAEINGIRVDILLCDSGNIENKINEKDYDIVLANIRVDETPDVEYLSKYLNINENINSKFEAIKNSDTKNIKDNVKSLSDALSLEVACIGIYATNTAVVYQKDIAGFENISYMNIFKIFQNIGKIAK